MSAASNKNDGDDRLSRVQEYKFATFDTGSDDDNVRQYQFASFDLGLKNLPEEKKKQLAIEKKFANENNFIVSPIVKHHRGIQAQEEEERQHRIQDEINRRIEKLKQDAFERGYHDGVEKGKKVIYDQLIGEVNRKIDDLEAIFQNTLERQHEVLKQQKMQIYEMVRSLTKWVILRELSEDGQYLERLLERLINEVGTKSNLHIQINKKHFDKMPDILAQLEQRLGKLQNVRVEAGIDIGEHGLNVESQNALIKGSLEEQLVSLDKLFLSVGLGDGDDKVKPGN